MERFQGGRSGGTSGRRPRRFTPGGSTGRPNTSGVTPPAREAGTTGTPNKGGSGGRRAVRSYRNPAPVRGSRPPHRGRAPQAPHTVLRTKMETNGGPIPPIGDSVRIIPLGGVEEIGRNMTAIQYKDDIIVVDCGFQFKEDETPGIDYILPNTKYLEDNIDKIRAMVITHAHLDHIGGIPYIMDLIGNPPIYTRNLTAIMVKKRQAEFPHVSPLDIRVVEKEDRVTLGSLRIRFFSVTHTVPDSMGVIIDTPYGCVVTPGDYKLTHTDGVPSDAEEKEYDRFKNENVLAMLCDSTNIENPGFSTPEWLVNENLDKIIRDIHGRLIIGTFASQLERIIGIIKIIEKYGKKLVLEGRSMKNNIEIAELAGIFQAKKGTIISSQDIDRYPNDKIVVLATGAQGEEFAALMRIANKAHKNFVLKEGDTVLLSSSIIPGNEKSVEKLKDNLARQGAKIMHYRTSEVYIHSTGHGNRGEIEWLHKKIKPKFFIPVHGNHYRLKLHADLAMSLGMPKDHVVVPDNGSIIEIQEQGTKMVVLPEKAPSNIRMVDGFSIGDMQEVVIRDRQVLAEDGMFVIIAMVNLKTGKLKKSPDIISRGFIYLRESQDMLQQTRLIAKKAVEDSTEGMNPINFDYVKKNLTEQVGSFLLQKTNKHPLVIPVVLGV